MAEIEEFIQLMISEGYSEADAVKWAYEHEALALMPEPQY